MSPRSSALALVLVACSPPSTTQEEGKTAPRAVVPTPSASGAACETSPSESAWARFDGGPCGYELREDGADALRLHELVDGGADGPRGEVPEPCRVRTCVYHGALSEAGPLVLAVAPSDDSEMPSTVLLGHVVGERLAFVDLWQDAGPSVDTDFTRVGPAHALVPHVCDGRLALLAAPRIDAGQGTAPPSSLVAREGAIDPSTPDAPPTPVDRAKCRAVGLPIP